MLAPFALAVLVGAMVPGPTAALILRRGALSGTRATFPLIAGMEIGVFTWALVTAAGVSALVAASETAYVVLKVVGAGFLIYLGIQSWRASRRGDQPVESTAEAPLRWRGVLTGLVTNLANPKMAVFFFAFYPQFMPSNGPVFATTVVMGLVHVVVDTAWYLLLAAAVGRARAWFARSGVRRWIERITGTVLIGLGVRMAVISAR